MLAIFKILKIVKRYQIIIKYIQSETVYKIFKIPTQDLTLFTTIKILKIIKIEFFILN